jgi:hypothetical protein
MLNKKIKNMIYVDASSLEGLYKIGLYDKTNHIKHTVELGTSVKKISDAECYAVLYGLLYIQKRSSQNRYVLMNDCESAVQNKKLLNLGNSLNTRIIWIPREINKADKIAKKRVNKKENVWKILDLFMKILFEGIIIKQRVELKDSIEKKIPSKVIVNQKSIFKKVLKKISSNPKIFPMSKIIFSIFIQKIYKEVAVPIKKGNIQEIRKELLDNKIILIKSDVISLTKVTINTSSKPLLTPPVSSPPSLA